MCMKVARGDEVQGLELDVMYNVSREGLEET